MKKFTLFFVMLASVVAFKANAQALKGEKCGTMAALSNAMKEHPELFSENAHRNAPQSAVSSNYRTNAIVTIPVVVHIVLPNPNLISNQDVQSVLDKWNIDFSGLNADSTNGVNFYNVRGHSQIRFALAKRTPAGDLTSGVERRVSNIFFSTSGTDPIKRSANGGLDAWNSTSYLNIWVGQDNAGILGYATFPGTASAADDGVVINAQSFSLNPCYTISQYNLGRTTAHEVGHYMGLYHIWGDETACAGDDFRQLTGTVLFPSGLFNPTGQGNTGSDVGDTPNQAGSTTNCPTGVATDACATAAPGKMYQNYMDYTADACYSMFTNKQVARMEWILDNARSGLKTSLGLTPPTGAILLDAVATASVNPGGSEYVGCNLVSYPANSSCPVSSFVPKVLVTNNGVTTLTSVTVSYTINGGTPVSTTATVNLLTGYSAVISFPAISTLSASGTYNFVYTVSAPNGGVDQVATNNTVSATYTVSAPGLAPISEGFESTTFPPTGWTLAQASGTGNWARVTTAFKTGAASAKFDNYNFTSGTSSTLTTPSFGFTPTHTIATLTFHYAHQSYTAAPNNEADRLEVLVSTNCGVSWTSVWSRQGSTLITATPANSTAAFTPTAAQWTSAPISVNLTPYLGQTIQVQFKATSGYGNNLYLDDVNITSSSLLPNDAQITAINVPLTEFCGSSFTPSVVVKNNGSATLTSVDVRYAVDPANGAALSAYAVRSFTGLSIPSQGTTTLTLNAVTGVTNGAHVFKAFTNLPNTVADQVATNDTLTKSFKANIGTTTFPITEGFETVWTGTATAPIPANGWTVINPDAATTWARSTLAAKTGTASVAINNYAYNAPGQLDYLRSPLVNFTGKDSAYITFHYAYKLYSNADTDTLDVMVSTDCGSNWTSVWQRGGAQLATTAGVGGAALTPTAADWTQTPIMVNLENYINSGDVYIAFRNKNDYGQRLFIDDINIVGKNIFNNDALLVEVRAPGTESCDSIFTPTVRVRNAGKLPITSLKVGYRVNANATVINTTFIGMNLLRGRDTLLNLTTSSVALTTGVNNLTFFTYEPSGVADQFTGNDTLKKAVTLKPTVKAPFLETFDTTKPTTFPPLGWDITEAPVNATKWTRFVRNAANSSFATPTDSVAAYMKNFNGTSPVATNSIDNLVTPPIVFNPSDSVFLTFDLSYANRQYPGNTVVALDTLEVQVTTDCGITWSSVYKKTGTDLQTNGDVNSTYTAAYMPTTLSQWRKERVNLTQYIANGGILRANFKHTSNNGNNLYIDNVNVASKTIPAKVKANSYMIAPNPTTGNFIVQHYLPPTNLRGLGVYNAAGQRIMYMSYTGNADSYITINLSKYAAGVYTIKLDYTNKTITDRIIKL